MIVSPIFVVLSKLPGADLKVCLDNINDNLHRWELYGAASSDEERSAMLAPPINTKSDAIVTESFCHSQKCNEFISWMRMKKRQIIWSA